MSLIAPKIKATPKMVRRWLFSAIFPQTAFYYVFRDLTFDTSSPHVFFSLDFPQFGLLQLPYLPASLVHASKQALGNCLDDAQNPFTNWESVRAPLISLFLLLSIFLFFPKSHFFSNSSACCGEGERGREVCFVLLQKGGGARLRDIGRVQLGVSRIKKHSISFSIALCVLL